MAACEALLDWVSSSSQSDDQNLQPTTTIPPHQNQQKDHQLHLRFSKSLLSFSKSRKGVAFRELEAPNRRPTPASYNKLMKALCEVGDLDHVLHLFEQLKQSPGCKPNVLCYNTVISALAAHGHRVHALKLFDEMLVSGIRPNVSSFNILVRLYACDAGEYRLAYETIGNMKKHAVSPDSTTFSTLIAGLCKDGRIGEAWGVVDWMLDERCAPTVHTYTPIVHYYCREGRIEEAKELMATMKIVGCQPNSVTYNVLVDALCRTGDFLEVKKIIGESELKGWVPNAVTYNSFMDALCKRGYPKEAFALLDTMLSKGIYPTAVTLNILLECLCQDCDVWKAKYLLCISSDLSWSVGTVGYNTVMSRLCETGDWVSVIKLFNDMLKKGIYHSTRTFNIMIHSLCIGRKFQKANCLISSNQFRADSVAYNTLIHWLYQERSHRDAQYIFFCMGNSIDRITYNTMIDGLCREGMFSEAVDYFSESIKYGFSSDLFSRLFRRLAKKNRLKEIQVLFTGIKRNGVILDVQVFDSLIKVFCEHGYCRSPDFYVFCHILGNMVVKAPL